MSVKIEGLAELDAALDDYLDAVEDNIADAVRVTALSVEADAIKSIQRGDKGGKIYKKTDPNRLHRASAPGEAPASDTGHLAKNIDSVIKPEFAYVGTPLKYGFYLEFGTMKMAERPWLRPAREKNKKLFRDRIKAGMIKAGRL